MVTVICFQIDRQQCSVPIIGNENQVSISIADPTAGDIPRDLKINIYLHYIVFGSTRKYKEDTKNNRYVVHSTIIRSPDLTKPFVLFFLLYLFLILPLLLPITSMTKLILLKKGTFHLSIPSLFLRISHNSIIQSNTTLK